LPIARTLHLSTYQLTDPWIVSAVADGIILVVKVGEVRRQDLDQTKEVLKTLGMPEFGVVINGIRRDQFGFDNRFNTLYDCGYSHGYGHRLDKVQPPFVPAGQAGVLKIAAADNGDGKVPLGDDELDAEGRT
jgi:hypothetical protein